MIIAKKEKEDLFLVGLNKIKNYLKKIEKNKSQKILKEEIYKFKGIKDLNYKSSFILLMALSYDYNIVLEKIRNKEFKQDVIQNKNFWYKEEHNLCNAEEEYYYVVFFIFRYLIELNPDIVYDFKVAENLNIEQCRDFINNL